MVNIGGRRLPADKVDHLLRGGLRYVTDVFFVSLVVIALVLTAINVKETFDALRSSWGSKSTAAAAAVPSPVITTPVIEACTSSQLETIEKQLPSEECVAYKEKPYFFGGLCSFSYATRCPQPLWLFRYYKQAKSSDLRQAIFVGSDKGRDVASALRLMTMNADYSIETWNKAFYQGKTVEGESCKTTMSTTLVVDVKTPHVDIFCIEPSKETAEQITQTSRTLHYEENLHVFNADITTLDLLSSEVPKYSLDTFVKKYTNTSFPIDILSINLEGQDPLVLAGADEALSHVRYLDFAYTWRGSWPEYSLAAIINNLKDKDFVCYWAGTGGNLWRITDCWLRHYDVRVWSHVACVKKSHGELLYFMEESFKETLKYGSRIKYDDKRMTETDGRS